MTTHRIFGVGFVIVWGLLPAVLSAAPVPDKPKATKEESPAQKLAKETATNLVIDPRMAKEAQATVSVELDEVPLESAVRLLAEMAGLKPVRLGNVLFVTSKTAAVSLRADPDLVPRPALPDGNGT